jgi:phage FluMu protein Com
MPASRAKFSKCGHRAFGVRCPRCKQAETLEARAEQAEQAGKTKAAAELRAEALRLRGPQTRGRKTVAPVQPAADGDTVG